MPRTHFSIPGKIPDPLHNAQESPLLPLNEIFNEGMKRMQAACGNSALIMRCESLPEIQGSKKEIASAFDLILGMILKHPPSGSKLFLYVECQTEISESVPGLMKEGFKKCTIRFHTNISANENWKKEHEQELETCKIIFSDYNGAFLVRDTANTGCLFSVVIPGKLQ